MLCIIFTQKKVFVLQWKDYGNWVLCVFSILLELQSKVLVHTSITVAKTICQHTQTKTLWKIRFRRLASAALQGGSYCLKRTTVNQGDIFYRNIQDFTYLFFHLKMGLKTRMRHTLFVTQPITPLRENTLFISYLKLLPPQHKHL